MISHFKKKQKEKLLRNRFFIKIGWILLFIIFFILIFANIKIYKIKKNLVFQLSSYKEQIGQIEKRNADLKEGIANSNDKDYIEKVAREQFGMQQAGEKAVAFVESEQKQPEPENTPKKNVFNISNWFGWLTNFLQSIK